jgi:hypothetical protein
MTRPEACASRRRPIHSRLTPRPPRARTAAHEGTAPPPQVALRIQQVVDAMSSDEKVLDFPNAGITSEEKARRAMAEAKRLASLTPGEWRLWIDRTAERLGVPRATLEGTNFCVFLLSA